ncbi:MAG TPA: hypothetical protein VFE62_04890 [Gemmataceae bacterium]|nr:hypothetical protein [Gemmataceae bacterium]
MKIGIPAVLVLVGQEARVFATLQFFLVLSTLLDPGITCPLKVSLEHCSGFLRCGPIPRPDWMAIHLRCQPGPEQRDQALVERQHILSPML